MNIRWRKVWYPEKLEGDEPEPLVQERWPVSKMMDLLTHPDFNEARNITALLFPAQQFYSVPVTKAILTQICFVLIIEKKRHSFVLVTTIEKGAAFRQPFVFFRLIRTVLPNRRPAG